MKLEVIDQQGNAIQVYEVPVISIHDFAWSDSAEIPIPLTQLLEVIRNLTPASELDPLFPKVVLYLPDPLINDIVDQLAATGNESKEEIKEQILTPPLKHKILLLAVVQEIIQNHLPNEDYKVRISE